MTNDTIDHSQMSVQKGRQWLQLTDETGLQVRATGKADELAIVSIPYFGDATGGEHPQQDVDITVVENSCGSGVENASIPSDPDGAIRSEHIRSSPTIQNDLAEDPNDWMDVSDSPRNPRINAGHAEFDSAISNLVDLVLERFPLAAPASLLFVGSENNPHTDETCALVAHALARRNVGEILLIDSNLNGKLTQENQLGKVPGLSQMINEDLAWEDLVVGETASGLDFMPSGGDAVRRWGGVAKLRNATAEMKSAYQFICVSAGDAHSEVARIWSGICDGSYLLVSLRNSNGDIAESAVAELQTSGARLLGCVVTDSV